MTAGRCEEAQNTKIIFGQRSCLMGKEAHYMHRHAFATIRMRVAANYTL